LQRESVGCCKIFIAESRARFIALTLYSSVIVVLCTSTVRTGLLVYRRTALLYLMQFDWHYSICSKFIGIITFVPLLKIVQSYFDESTNGIIVIICICTALCCLRHSLLCDIFETLHIVSTAVLNEVKSAVDCFFFTWSFSQH